MRNKQILSSIKESTFNVLRTADQIIGQLHFDVSHACKDTVLLAGSARGGTTWVSEFLNFDNAHRLIFEPISHYKDRSGKTVLWGQYIRTKDHNPHFVNPVRNIVSGRSRSGYSDRFNRHLFPRRRLIKDVGINLLLHWLHSHFPEIPLILLLRHPCGVINSRIRVGWAHRGVDNFLKQEALMSDFLSPFKRDMETASPFERHVMHWCTEIFVPLKQFRPGQIHVAFYENFRVKPRPEIERLFNFLGKPVDVRVFKALERPSKQTRLRKSRELPPTARFDDWRQHFSDEELAAAQDVLRRFGLDSLYRPDGMPDEDAALKLLGA